MIIQSSLYLIFLTDLVNCIWCYYFFNW